MCPQIYYYADSIYGSAGVEENDIQYVTVGTGAVNVFMTITAVSIHCSMHTIYLHQMSQKVSTAILTLDCCFEITLRDSQALKVAV